MSMKETEVVSTRWLENMSFESEINGHKVIIDAKEEVGGQDKGPRPKPLMLAALGGCTAMDVVSILKKMRVVLKSLNVIVEGELSEEHPKRFTKMHVIYEVEGNDLPLDKIEKAVALSEEKYCGVSAVYREVIEITSEIRIKA
jgi:putative redox protein